MPCRTIRVVDDSCEAPGARHTHLDRRRRERHRWSVGPHTRPIEGRIAAIADVFDALTSVRVYKKAVPMNEAIEIMKAERGSHFDLDLLDYFFSSRDSIVAIESELALV